MKKIISSLAILAIIASCGAGSAPKGQNDACKILKQRSSWEKPLRRTEQKWGVPMSVQMAIIWKESSFRPRARPRTGGSWSKTRSSAYGYPQALDGTWDWYKKDTGRRRAKRNNFADATDFVGWYAQQSLERSGVAKNDAYNLYLTYHQGHGGYNRGSHQSQAWLLRVARQVQNRANLYRSQLPYCR